MSEFINQSKYIHEEVNPNIYYDSSRPLVRTFEGNDRFSETHSGINIEALIRRESFIAEEFILKRTVSRNDSELVDWSIKMMPILSPNTISSLNEVVKGNSLRGMQRVSKILFENIPSFDIGKDTDLVINMPKSRIAINDSPTDVVTTPSEDLSYAVLNLPMDSFTNIDGLNGLSDYVPSAVLRIKRDSMENIKNIISECIQNARFSESRIRSLINISFELRRKGEVEGLVLL